MGKKKLMGSLLAAGIVSAASIVMYFVSQSVGASNEAVLTASSPRLYAYIVSLPMLLWAMGFAGGIVLDRTLHLYTPNVIKLICLVFGWVAVGLVVGSAWIAPLIPPMGQLVLGAGLFLAARHPLIMLVMGFVLGIGFAPPKESLLVKKSE